VRKKKEEEEKKKKKKRIPPLLDLTAVQTSSDHVGDT